MAVLWLGLSNLASADTALNQVDRVTPYHLTANLGEWLHRDVVAATTQRLFEAEDFASIEKAAVAFRTEKSRSDSGLWNLSILYGGLVKAIDDGTQARDNESSYRQMRAKISRWSQQFPESPTPRIAMSIALLEQAWAYRGNGFASEVKQKSWAPFRRCLQRARANLEKYKAVASVDPRWYESMLIIAKGQNWTRAKFDALLNEALEREPLYYPTYFMALDYLEPQWHGNIDEVEKFALASVTRTRDQEGQALYARIYWFASQGQFGNDVFANSRVDWLRMKQGFEDMTSRYPDPWNLNHFAKFACLARDKATTGMLLRRTAGRYVPQAWNPEGMYEKCHAWAKEKANEIL